MQIALAQLNSTRELDANLETSRRMAHRASDRGADWLLFPENAPFLGSDGEKAEVAEPIDGPIVDHYRRLARQGDFWVTLGSFPEQSDDPERTYNTQLLISPDGEIASIYRKLHLFDVDVEGGRSFRESDHVKGGSEVVTTRLTGGEREVTAGLTICYDLRFPELYRELVGRGAEILTVPSAFTLQTGRDHWHPLLQARAIENQCWVLAPNQWGHHFGDRSSYGQSAVYDPWGRRVACASDRQTIIFADIDLEQTDTIRREMPCLDHPRLGPDGQVDEPT
jgi:predicted amidohydrolase